MEELAERIAAEIEHTRETWPETAGTESYIAGLRRAMGMAVGNDRARALLAARGIAE